MRIVVTVSLKGDEGELIGWLDDQQICTVSYEMDNYHSDEPTVLTIEPVGHCENAEQASHFAPVWSRFVCELMEQGFCF